MSSVISQYVIDWIKEAVDHRASIHVTTWKDHIYLVPGKECGIKSLKIESNDLNLGHMPHMLSLNYAPYIERVDNIIQFVYNSFCKVRPKAETKSNPLYGAF